MGPKSSSSSMPQLPFQSNPNPPNQPLSNQNQKINRIRCPICSSIFQPKNIREFQTHFDRCQTIKKNKATLATLRNKLTEYNESLETFNLIQALEAQTDDLEKRNQRALNQISLVNNFEDKIDVFRSQLVKMKVDWVKGCETIEIERDNILYQSMSQFNKIDPYKELKIAFKGEVNHDAGGLIREWLNVHFKIFFSEETNLFQKADTENISYLVKNGLVKTTANSSLFFFIGQLIGKALLENLTINCCFNKLIYKILLEEKIDLEDLIFIDKRLYHSLKDIAKLNNVEDLELYHSIQYQTDKGDIKTEELVVNGDNIKVTNTNVKQYIDLRINHLVNSQKTFIDLIKNGINKIISSKILQQLTSDEFELVLNGTPFIDLEDWRESTTYKDYKDTDDVIVEFWRVLSTLSQDNLSHILQFCTGSSRVPIGGFSSLESNRGNLSPFCITKCPYIANSKNFIRAHTCFNRLDIPNFPTKAMLQTSITFILKNEALGFGID